MKRSSMRSAIAADVMAEVEADPSEEDRSAILIVDDLPEKLLVFGTVLEELDQELVFVRSGSQALKEVLKREFAVILLDVNMPDIDGLQTASLIRQYKRSAHTPIIFMTAYADEMQTHRGYELGAVDYILSPVVPQVLRSKVQVFVDLHVMQRRVRRQAEQRLALAAAEGARRVAEENTRRSNWLAQVSRVLSGPLEAEVGMQALLRLVVPQLAERAALLLQRGEGLAQHDSEIALSARHIDQGELAFEQRSLREWPAAFRAAFQQALAGRLTTVGGDAVHGHGDLQEGTVVPLQHGDQVLGALFVAGPVDADLLGELAERAAIAFDNARLYRSLRAEIEDRRQAEVRLQESNRRKDEFLAMLSHELRNPLAPIRNAVEVIRRVAGTDQRLAWATDITDRQVVHLTRLVEELLDVARINQGKIALQFDSLELQAVIAHGVETVRPLIDSRGHKLHLDLPSHPVWLRGDAARLSQVVANLLHNAAKYTPDGGSLQVALGTADGQAVVSVRDNGMGIEPDLLPNVFELFEQGKRSLDRSQGGLGVGLTLVQRLVQLHHGQVEAHSAGAGCGSEFVVRLPCMSEVVSETPSVPPVPDTQGASGCRVLVVDDNVDAADTVAVFLRMEGHSVETASDGPQALSRAAAFEPDVVVLDIGLPGLDGYQVAQRLRRTPAHGNALLIALTGYGQREDQALARQAGFDHHLVKPADPRLLVRLVAQWRQSRAALAPMVTVGASDIGVS